METIARGRKSSGIRLIRRSLARALASLASLAAASLPVPLAAQTSAASDAAIKGDGGPVRLLYSQFGTNSFPPYIMQKYNLDKKHGFELVLVPSITDEARMMALQAGAAEMGTIDWGEVSRMRMAGVDVVGVAPFLRWGADFVVVTKDSPIKTIADLKGKKLGVWSLNGLNWIVERAVAQNIYHFDLEKESIPQAGSMPLLSGLVEQGQLDATEMFNSLTPGMVASGKFRVLVKESDLVHQLGLPDVPYLMYTTTQRYTASHPENVRAFVAAYRDAVAILMTNDAVWLEHGAEMKMTDRVSALFRDEARTDLMSGFKPSNEADIRRIFGVLLATAGPAALGMSEIPPGFITLDFQ